MLPWRWETMLPHDREGTEAMKPDVVVRMELKCKEESTSAPARMILKLASAALRRKKL